MMQLHIFQNAREKVICKHHILWTYVAASLVVGIYSTDMQFRGKYDNKVSYERMLLRYVRRIPAGKKFVLQSSLS